MGETTFSKTYLFEKEEDALFRSVHCTQYKTDALYRKMVNETIADHYEADECKGIYHWLFGVPFFEPCNTCVAEREQLTWLWKGKNDNPSLSDDRSSIYHIYGMPGPDYEIFRFEDYGITWAFTIAGIHILSYEEWKKYDLEGELIWNK